MENGNWVEDAQQRNTEYYCKVEDWEGKCKKKKRIGSSIDVIFGDDLIIKIVP